MIIICGDCGKKYRLDPVKLQGRAARFKCKSCNHLIQLPDPEQMRAGSAADGSGAEQVSPTDATDQAQKRWIDKELDGIQASPNHGGLGTENAEQLVTYPADAIEDDGAESSAESPFPDSTPPTAGRHSLRFKMVILFFILPITLFAGSSALFLVQTNRLENLLTNESAQIVNRMAEDKIADLSRAVATQCRIYLKEKPSLKKEKFAKDANFKALAVQPVGTTGYTALYERPDKDGIWRTWSHVQPKIIGIDMASLKKPLGQNFAGFWRVFTGVEDGKESMGYYTWKDSDDRLRKKYMVCTPIEGTPYVIAATTYLEELTQSVNDLKVRSQSLARQVMTTIAIILAVTLVMIGAIVLIYGYRLTSRLKRLTEVADRISIGDLDADISDQTKDEIGELAEAISRMQESIRLSIDRLRSKR